MSDFDLMRLRRLDLTVLLVFLGVMRHRKAVAVAAELRLTPSSISHALARLRSVMGDPLFLRRPHGLEPTAAAVALEPPIRRLIEELGAALAGQHGFAPAAFAGAVRIGGTDYELATLLPPLLRVAGASAPGMRVVARAIGRTAALDALATGELDLALGYFAAMPKACVGEELYREDFLVVGRADDPRLADGLSVADYTAARHIVMSPAGELHGVIDDVLAERGLARAVVAAVPLFFPAFAAVAETGCLTTLPRRLAQRYAAAFGLVTADPPVPLQPFAISAVRHRRDERNPLHAWLAAVIRAELTPPAPAPA